MRLVLKIFLGLGFLCLMIILMNNASADIHTTQASGNAGTAGTWDNGVPDAGDDLVFTGAYNIAMNQALTYGTITLAAGYSGTATQGAVDFGYTDFTMSAGTWTGLATQTQTCSGNFNRIGGTTTPWATRLIMTGTDKILSINSGQGLHSLTVSGTVIINQAEGMYAASNGALVVSGELKLSTFQLQVYSATITVNGVISGTGTLKISGTYNAITLSGTGTISAPIRFDTDTTSRTITLDSALALTGAETVQSTSGTAVVTFDLKGHTIAPASLTVNARGTLSSTVAGARVISGGAITVAANGVLDASNIPYISCGGNWDVSAGTWTPDDGQVNLTSSYKAIKLGAGQTMYDLQLVNNDNVTGATDATHNLRYVSLVAGEIYTWAYGTTIISYDHIANGSGQIDLGAQTLAVHNLYFMDLEPEITSTPITSSIIGHLYSYDSNASEAGTWALTSSYADLDIDIDGIVSGFLSTNELSPVGDSITINITFTDSLGVKAYQNYTITVGGVQEDLIPLGVGVISIVIIVGLTTLAIGSVRRKMH